MSDVTNHVLARLKTPGIGSIFADAAAEIESLRQERDEARKALRKYGSHSVGCERYRMTNATNECVCGLDAAFGGGE